MAYEIFSKKTPRLGNPAVSFSRIGQVAFNQYAARLLQKHGVEFVLLLWDKEAGKIGIKSTTDDKDPRAYRVRYNDKGNGASFSAKTFLDFIGIDYGERTSIPVDITPTQELLVEIKVPDSLLAKKVVAVA